MMRPFWTILGIISLGLGLAGIPLPVLPTTPFILLAAFSFGKSSPRLRNWLADHARFGPMINDWETSGAIAPRHKKMAVGMMALAFVLSLLLGMPGWVLLVQAICLGGAGWFVLSRPNGQV